MVPDGHVDMILIDRNSEDLGSLGSDSVTLGQLLNYSELVSLCMKHRVVFFQL